MKPKAPLQPIELRFLRQAGIGRSKDTPELGNRRTLMWAHTLRMPSDPMPGSSGTYGPIEGSAQHTLSTRDGYASSLEQEP
jgi:hypothetical protein